MAVVNDIGGGVTNNWSGTGEDDLLVYKDGFDVIDGGGGYDTLVMPYPQSDYVYSYQNGVVLIDESPQGNSWSIDRVTGMNIEQIQFFDQTVALVPRPSAPPSGGGAGSSPAASRSYSIPLGKGGRWVKSNRIENNDTWWIKSGKGRRRRYLVDNDVTRISGVNASTDSLILSEGAWSSVYYRGAWGGTLLTRGNNVLAFLDGLNSNSFESLNLQ